MITVEEIHLSLVNGQNKQAAWQIKEYRFAAFVEEYPSYLNGMPDDYALKYFTKAMRAYAINRGD